MASPSPLRRECQQVPDGYNSLSRWGLGDAEHEELQDGPPNAQAGTMIGRTIRGVEGVIASSYAIVGSQHEDL
jgi:hypothetical protein